MTETALQLAVILLAPWTLGIACLRVAGIRAPRDRIGFAAWAYVAGSLAVAATLALWLQLGLPLRGAALFPALAAVATLLWLWPAATDGGARGAPAIAAAPPPPPPSLAERVERAVFLAAVAVLAVATIDRLALQNSGVVAFGDEAHIWSAKAKALFHAGRVDARFHDVATRAGFVNHADYPSLNPLLQLWAFVVAGRIDDVMNRVPIQAFVIAGVLAFASALRRTLRPGAAALCLFLLAPTDVTASIVSSAESDFMVALGLLIALDAWTVFAETGEAPSLRLAAIGLALAAWSKHEGEALLAACIVAAAVAVARDRDRRRRLFPSPWRLAWLALPVAAVAYTAWFNAAHGFRNDLAGANPTGKPFWTLALEQLPDRAWPIARAFARDVLFDVGTSRLVLLAFFAACLFAPRTAFGGARRAGAIALLLAIAIDLLAFAGSYQPLAWHLDTALRRVFYQLVPAAALWSAGALAALAPPLSARDRSLPSGA